MSGVTYLRRWGLSFNEGGRFFSLHLNWRRPYFYIFALGHRFAVASFKLTAGPGNRLILGGRGLLG